MPYKNALREKLRQGIPVLGAFFKEMSPNMAEMMGVAGLDFIIVDCEHSPMTTETAGEIYRAAELYSVTTLTRIGENNQQSIQRYLDAGSEGVQIPLINTAEAAQAVVDAVKYPPVGKRGMAGPRLAGYGRIGIADFIQQWNEESLVCIQIETPEGIANCAEIVKVPGIDIVFFGPMDLSVALGYPGQVSHPEVVSVIERLGRQVIEAGKVAGTIVNTLDQYKQYRGKGFLYCASVVTVFLMQGAKDYVTTIGEYEKSL
ncbi:MAG: aldolase/citrate lyase family protein [Dehalococcoidia bacterium]|jgi:4-hydroxy-2-oxoheptanedioate aldolase|nr:aldolase/citrate lyase family protein [Dehalococcoidia bacterium]